MARLWRAFACAALVCGWIAPPAVALDALAQVELSPRTWAAPCIDTEQVPPVAIDDCGPEVHVDVYTQVGNETILDDQYGCTSGCLVTVSIYLKTCMQGTHPVTVVRVEVDVNPPGGRWSSEPSPSTFVNMESSSDEFLECAGVS
jgi:hypothetical protein